MCGFFIFSGIAATFTVHRGLSSSPLGITSDASADVSGSLQLSSQTGMRSLDGLWEFVEESSIAPVDERQVIPQVYKTARVKEDVLRQLLGNAPLEFTQEAKNRNVALALPTPDGKFLMFRIEESPIMEPQLAGEFPDIKTYRGQGMDDPTATTRLDLTPAGLHGMILSERGTVYIDPYAKGDRTNYIVYFQADYLNDAKQFSCYFSEDTSAHASQPVIPNVLNGTILRTYRLALAATGEYTAFTGGTVATALATITTTMNRVDGIYERELAVRMILIANEASIIYTNAATDPYTNNSGTTMLGQNQANIDAVIGFANYDIGHVFSTGGGGVASVGVVCTASKARGVTGSSSPVGDGFDVDYVAHEMGHQFGGLHTFNGTISNCGGGNRSSSAAYEPGSGSTIMAYAGICGSQDLQLHSDDYFHVKSLEQMAAFIGGTSCDLETNTGNALPTVTVGPTVTIPKVTPFTLTASGSDPAGDALTYCWEEYNLGPSSPPDTDADGNPRPIFRSFNPTTSPSRTFPKLSDVLNNTSTFGEALPTINQTMNFQVTVRDNRAGGGGITTATAQVVVTAGAGPFVVTQPNTNVNWTGGTQQSVTWDVANTSAAPVSCTNVRISLSTNGGNTFPIVLAASTPNDGNQTITVPNVATTMGRIKVQGVGNVFFDVSNANFTIVHGTSGGSRAAFDFDGDGITDLGFYRSGLWGMLQSSQSFSYGSGQFISWGGSGLQPIAADFDGDGRADFGYMVPPAASQSAAYAILKSTANYYFSQAQFVPAGFPSLGDTPVVGDFDGDGKADPGIWRSSNGVWIIPRSSDNYATYIFAQWGQSGDIPVVGDLDGDWRADIGFYRNGLWGFLKSSQNYALTSAQFFSWGGSGLAPIVADFDGDGKADIGYVAAPAEGQSAVYSILQSSTGYSFAAGQVLFVPAGFPALGDTPVVGDFDGDGKADPGIWRSSQGVWIIPLSSANYASFLFSQWGVSGDVPIPYSTSQY
jgi:hypothetical protein